MASVSNWSKVENEAGYPCYFDQTTGKQQFDHPLFGQIIESLQEYDGIKYSIYRTAFKIVGLQRQLRVPPLRIVSGVFAHHRLSLSESSLSLDTAELEAVFADIYFAAEKEGLFDGDVDLAVDLLINLLLNIYDRNRKEPIKVTAAKILLILLCEDPITEKWSALSQCCADHNGCVSTKRLTLLLTYIKALSQYLGEYSDHIEADVDTCFAKSAGMLGVTSRSVSEWGVVNCSTSRWLSVVSRVHAALKANNNQPVKTICVLCNQPLLKVLKFKCSKCCDMYICDKCYLYDKDLGKIEGHKKTHVIYEIIDGESKPSERISFIKGMKQLFFCSKRKKKGVKKHSKNKAAIDRAEGSGTLRHKKDGRPVIFTSTVGKASGKDAKHPTQVMQDIIAQVESLNNALRELSTNPEKADASDDLTRAKEELHASISEKLARLKELMMENLMPNSAEATSKVQKTDEKLQAFNLFSPIQQVKEKRTVCDNENKGRVLSMDSGNFSVASKHMDSENLLEVSGDALKPVVVNATSDSISAVSMNDISTWYNDPEKQSQSKKRTREADITTQSLTAMEARYDADIRSVKTSNDKMKVVNADLDSVLDRLQQILNNNFAVDDSTIDNTQLQRTANEMEGLLGSLIRGVEQRVTLNASLRDHEIPT